MSKRIQKIVFGTLLATGLMTASTAMAAPYGAAGCGLGSIVFGDKPGFSQIFAMTTNGVFGSQFWGILFGTSNCGATSVSVDATKVFIEANKEALAKDIARGNGETISNLASLAGCEDSSLVGASLQKDFSTIFPSESVSSEVVVGSIINKLSAENLHCGNLS